MPELDFGKIVDEFVEHTKKVGKKDWEQLFALFEREAEEKKYPLDTRKRDLFEFMDYLMTTGLEKMAAIVDVADMHVFKQENGELSEAFKSLYREYENV
ncbi:Oidioi.mRNA.OKI2018_I69.chr1.g774.t1.cds [Oikopleura dioica]|uniref:Oidioi.mRNA.OKI2018_I69.chr1.g774.t1.cds n=1 Tax=Oikopleura dioica TaxID=34765 RepID=A0ABN7SQV9_OIKDI|nr:Oidioi.mRNA.OKI2018_I69.chr1.g774.t1.cds [Oikopleura dioica]